MNTEFRSTCECVKSWVDDACRVALDYFNNHSHTVIFWKTDDFDDRHGNFLEPNDDVGRKQQKTLSELMDKIAVVSDRLNCGGDILCFVEDCRSLFAEPCHSRGYNHYQKFENACASITKAIDSEPDITPGGSLLVADTNSLLRNPDLATWTFEEIPKFTIVVPSIVLS